MRACALFISTQLRLPHSVVLLPRCGEHIGCCWSVLQGRAGSKIENCACRAYDYDPEKMGKAEAVQDAPAITTKPDPSAMLPGHVHGAAAQARLTKALQELQHVHRKVRLHTLTLSNYDRCEHHSLYVLDNMLTRMVRGD